MSEQVARRLAADGVRVSVVRLGQVHDTALQGLVTPLIGNAKAAGGFAYVGGGAQRWAAVHLSDAARLFRLAPEAGSARARYPGVDEEGVPMRAIAEAIGRALAIPTQAILPKEAPRHFGPMALFAGAKMEASAHGTKRALGRNRPVRASSTTSTGWPASAG